MRGCSQLSLSTLSSKPASHVVYLRSNGQWWKDQHKCNHKVNSRQKIISSTQQALAQRSSEIPCGKCCALFL